MKVIKKTAAYTVYQKRSGRYAVKSSGKKLINAEEKVKILLAESLIKVAPPGEPAPEPEEKTTEQAVPEEAAVTVPAEDQVEEEAAEETPAEEVIETSTEKPGQGNESAAE